MQSFQLTTQLLLIIGVVSIVLVTAGYLLSMVLQSRKPTEVSPQLEQAQHALAQVTSQNQQLQSENKKLNTALHEKEIAESKLKENLRHAQGTEQRLHSELVERKNEFAARGNLLDETRKQYNDTEKLLENAQADVRAQKEQVQELRDRLAAQERRNEDLVRENKTLDKSYTQLKTEQDEREASHAREVNNFEQQKASLSEQFKLLSNEILDAKAKTLQESSKLTMNAVMTPFQQSIDNFKKEVQEIHHRETTQQGELRKELEHLKTLNQQITTEAHELSTALRGQKKLQGNWGELVLENVLDRSGLQLGKDYKREVSFTTEEGRQRPDAIVYLPQGKHLIIDAKVSLNAYTRFVNAEDEAERAIALKEHVQAVASRIKELSDRDYYKLPGLNSPDIVFMFIPIESAFVEALKADETLFQKAIENNVLVATPTTLLTSLNIVKQLWRFEDQNKHTAALANKADVVFSKLNTFLGSFEKIKKGLDSASEAYHKAEGQLISGKGNLVKQVGDFKKLAPAIRGELPSYFVDKAALEIDFIPVDVESLQSQEDDNANNVLTNVENKDLA